MDLWTHKIERGPAMVTATADLRTLPMWARVGSLVFSAPDVEYTEQQSWSEVVIESFVPEKGSVSQTLYEDDRISNEYKKGAYGKTVVTLTRQKNVLKFKISPMKGSFRGKLDMRKWIARIHMDQPITIRGATVDAKPAMIYVAKQLTNPSPTDRDFPFSQPSIDTAHIVSIDGGYLSTSRSHEIVIELG